MITVNLKDEKLDLETLINLARRETVVILTLDGKEFVIAEADDFEQELTALRNSQAFQQFLAERSQSIGRVPLKEIEAEIERELSTERKSN